MNVLIKEILWNHHTLLGFCLQLASLLRRFMNTQQTALTFQENDFAEHIKKKGLKI